MPAPNLAALLNTKADEVERPLALPDGTYFGIIRRHEFITSSQKKTPGVQYTSEITHAHEDVDLADYLDKDGNTKEVRGKEVRSTFWLSEKALFMLTDFIESCGIDPAGRSLGELIPQVIGQPVVLDIVRTPLDSGEGFRNEIRSVKGAQAA